MPVLLVTRPEPDATDTAHQLEALGLDTIRAPMLVMKPLETALPAAGELGALVLTSANAIRALEARGQLDAYLDLPVFTVGDRTAEAASEAGFARVESAAGTVDDLAALLTRAAPDGPVLYPAAYHLSADLAGELAPHGIDVRTVRIYDMLPAHDLPEDVQTRIAAGTLVGVVFYSRRTAETFCHLVNSAGLTDKARRDIMALCLSENVAEVLVEAGFVRIALADHPSAEAMVALALSFARDQIGQ